MGNRQTQKKILKMDSPDKIGHFSYPNHKNRPEIEKVILSLLEAKYSFSTKNTLADRSTVLPWEVGKNQDRFSGLF